MSLQYVGPTGLGLKIKTNKKKLSTNSACSSFCCFAFTSICCKFHEARARNRTQHRLQAKKGVRAAILLLLLLLLFTTNISQYLETPHCTVRPEGGNTTLSAQTCWWNVFKCWKTFSSNYHKLYLSQIFLSALKQNKQNKCTFKII